MSLDAQNCNSPRNLTVDITAGCDTVTLTWEAPEIVAKAPKAPIREWVDFFEDFEDTALNGLPAGWTKYTLGNAHSWLVDDDSVWEEGYVAFSGRQWAACWWDNEASRNSWMFSPGIKLIQGVEYTISFWTIMGYEPGDGDNLELQIARSPTVAGIDTTIYRITNGFHFDWTQIKRTYKPKVTGTYYLGFHAFTSVSNGYDILIEDVKITRSVPVYNIYRDNMLLVSVAVTSFIRVNPNPNPEEWNYHTWSVTQVCDKGVESNPATAIETCIVGINENVATTFSIAPNPATGRVKISAGKGFHTIEIISFLGQTVLSQSHTGNEATLDISTLPNGIYFVRIISDNGMSVKKLVKQ